MSGIDPTQSFLTGQFAEGGLKTPVLMTIVTDQGLFPQVTIVKGFQQTRKKKDSIIVLEAIFKTHGRTSAWFHWVVEGEERQLSSSDMFAQPIDVISIKSGNHII
jgi:hypothetical protein